MKMIFLTGDTHGGIDVSKLSFKNWKESKNLTKNDFLIILGDFGFLWNNIPDRTEEYWLKWLTEKPYTTLFLAGNHENYFRLNNLEQRTMFGGTVGKVTDSVFHLKTGEIYTINGQKLLTIGGAASIDKNQRTPHISWWPEELLSKAEENFTLDNLE